ncbi:hypothetical protein [Arthrobacter oryzae]|uniref:Uncharacterized protein n=1 Tax=Arthrobacter oryzae TaxID=409290 RepID=A0A495FP79_9MICC|nr:hypothetical protein [Arthrobacter oryzae]RKR30537.1 hypothetical protein C8D78_0862 [Arthrobacter oryzae]
MEDTAGLLIINGTGATVDVAAAATFPARTCETAAAMPSGVTSKSAGPSSEQRGATMSPKREPRFWKRENASLIVLGIGILLVLIAAGIVVWVINIAPVISRITGS